MKKNIVIKQEEISDCGACCLLSIIRYYKGNASLENIRINSLTNHNGVTALNLINCAKKYGFDAKGLKINSFKGIAYPVIAHVNINESLSHFIVIYDELDTCFKIMDPAYGYKTIKKDEFMNMFSGNIIELKPRNIVNEDIKINITYKNIINTYKKKLIPLVLIFISMLFIVLMSLIYDLHINIALIYNNIPNIFIIFMVILLLKEIITYIISINKQRLIDQCKKELLTNFYNHIFKLPLKYIHLKDPGEILKRINELESINDFIVNFLLNLSSNLFLLIPMLVIIFIVERFSFIITICCCIAYLAYTIYVSRNIKELIDSNIISSTSYSSIEYNYISCLNSIKHINNNYYFISNINTQRDNYIHDNYRLKKYISKNNMIKNIILCIFQLINNYFLIKGYYQGIITIELILAANTLFISITSSMNSIINDIPSLFYYLKLMKKIDDFYNIKEEVGIKHEIYGGDIHVSNLSYSFNNIDNIIENISFDIKNKEKVFIKGISGSGKSTICKILAKDITGYKGIIKYNNTSLDNINLDDISKFISYNSQNESLFIGTIKDNIILGRNISNSRFKDIAKICNLEQVVHKMPFKYDTFLHGINDELSGGERNLILLARALIEDKDIYILDESLANVNEELEIKVLNNILKYFKNKTIIYISHRDKSEYFDRVINV